MVFRPVNKPWNKGMDSLVTLTCFGCGVEFERPAWEARRHKAYYCSRVCAVVDPVYKRCTECGLVLPISEFQKQGKSKLTGRQYYNPRCRVCFAPIAYMNQAKRRAWKAGAVCDYTLEQWNRVLAFCDWKCVYCGASVKDGASQDHFVPISRGGPHTASNVLPACRSCNSGKNNSQPQEWLEPARFRQLSAILNSLG